MPKCFATRQDYETVSDKTRKFTMFVLSWCHHESKADVLESHKRYLERKRGVTVPDDTFYDSIDLNPAENGTNMDAHCFTRLLLDCWGKRMKLVEEKEQFLTMFLLDFDCSLYGTAKGPLIHTAQFSDNYVKLFKRTDFVRNSPQQA
ncbi:hypothetical protein RRG08_037309 [Elysia crispata]|uniref:Uncharacterized protein n=1 Tax=Elysia crispata TaxID=231223 RepID=A0AAE1AH70_9GAST|nr:hypothetical protein RRG08_037309 [Elysia crispata]